MQCVMSNAAYIVRRGEHKYNPDTGCEPELFDLARNPEETRNLAQNSDFGPARAALEAWLHWVLVHEATDRRARVDQAKHIAVHGGRRVILARERLHATPAPEQYRSGQ